MFSKLALNEVLKQAILSWQITLLEVFNSRVEMVPCIFSLSDKLEDISTAHVHLPFLGPNRLVESISIGGVNIVVQFNSPQDFESMLEVFQGLAEVLSDEEDRRHVN
mmetsp:Transcript_40874/g.62295  ORF Transcript_40874/g.62295 Transcript_40874/m.62295 type:complete len:107 (-) Transcript_40874:1920-2240(-)